jgi:DNA-directed RNA polymerase specialized sigma24 family protein
MKTAVEMVRAVVARVVQDVGAAFSLQEDLMQEALVHLWWKQLVCPGHRPSWYLKSCHFHLLDYLRNGRSVDSVKRSYLACELSGDNGEDDCPCNHPIAEEVARSRASALDILAVLKRRLNRTERKVLDLIAEGWGVSEVAAKLRVSHQAVSKCWRKIAALARRLGIFPR